MAMFLPTSPELPWCHPAVRDALPLKRAKLARQLMLSRHALADAVLPPGFADCRVGALARGCVFYHCAAAASADAAPWQGWAAPLVRSWPRQDDDSRWLWLPRLRWLSPALAQTSDLVDEPMLRARLSAATAPQRLAEMRRSGDGGANGAGALCCRPIGRMSSGWPACGRK